MDVREKWSFLGRRSLSPEAWEPKWVGVCVSLGASFLSSIVIVHSNSTLLKLLREATWVTEPKQEVAMRQKL